MQPLHVKTPYVKSLPLTKQLGEGQVYMKLDALQTSGSFKDRGMLHFCQALKQKGVKRVVAASGGNAGLAVAYSGVTLEMDAHIVVPQSTKEVVIEKIRMLGATVEVHGVNFNEADDYAKELGKEEGTEYCHPFDHPLVWTGNSSIVDEMKEQGPKPDVIVLVVGGGGLLCGVLEGLKRNDWGDVDVITVEAKGAESFNLSFEKGELCSLPSIDSICTSLGALTVASECLPRAKAHGRVTSVVVTDTDAVKAMIQFSTDHRILVEPACAAALSLFYCPENTKHLDKYRGKTVAVVVCGGNASTIELMQEWKAKYL